MLAGILGFFPARAAATLQNRITVDLLKEWFAAIGNAAFDESHRASFANSRTIFPSRMNRTDAKPTKTSGGEF
jgi:hypothetical protein